MNKTLKIILASLWILIALVLTVFLIKGLDESFDFHLKGFKGWKFSKSWGYTDGSLVESTSSGPNTEVVNISNNISKLDVELINEKFTLEVWDENYAEITIVSSYPESYRPKVYQNGETVQIKAPNRNNAKLRIINDYVTVKLPKSFAKNLSLCDVDIVSGSVTVSDIKATKGSFSTVSGSVSISDSDFSKLVCDSVSGSLKTDNCKVEEISGESVSGSIHFVSDVKNNFNLSSVSGSIKIETNTMPSLGGDCEAMSGSVRVYIPENDGFTLNYETVSGSVTNEFTNSKFRKSGENTYKNGNVDFDIQTISGSISVLKK